MLSIDVIGIILTLIFGIPTVLALYLKLKRSAEEKADKDIEIIYEPLLDEISKLIECEDLLRTIKDSKYFSYVSHYKDIRRRGKVSPKPHRELQRDMDDLVERIDEEDKAFNILLNKMKPLCKKTLESIPVILTNGKIRNLNTYLIIDVYEIIYGNREEWGTNFDNKIKQIEERTEVDRIELKVTGKAIFDQLFSQIRNERKDFFSKRDEIFTKAKEIKKKLDLKAKHRLKRYGKQ